MAQNYKNHLRFYTPHHFVFYPLLSLLIAGCCYQAFNDPGQRMFWLAIALVLSVCVWLSFMMRQHYALMNQNRIVRLEMRLRYYQLTGQRFDPLEQQLSFGQLAALRFASDAELPALVQRTLSEQLSPDAIKRAIIQWVPDDMRV